MKAWPFLNPLAFTRSQTLAQVSREYLRKQSNYEASEVQALVKHLIAHQTCLSPAQILADYPLNLSPEQRESYTQKLYRIGRHEPLQYILGETYFLNRSFWVNPSVLIPRPETEELTQRFGQGLRTHFQRQSPSQNILGIDLGTGSACIAISLAKEFPQLRMSGLDISPKALSLAYWNAWRHQVRLNWIQGDILRPDALALSTYQWDFIISNPPYVLESDRAQMHANVLGFEPAQALFVPDEKPLLFYEAILKIAAHTLKPGGLIAWEIHEKMGGLIAQALRDAHYQEVQIEKDLFGKDRFAFARKA